jgi:hypothetical protein
MPFLKEQIDIINKKLSEVLFSDKRFAGAQINGVASLATYKDGDAIKTSPVVMDQNYEARWVGLDDTYPLIIYHRITGISYSQQGNSAPQFGRASNKVSQAAEIYLVVYGRFAPLQLTTEKLEALLVAGFPDLVGSEDLAPLGLDSMFVTLISSNLNSPQVYAGEYTGTPLKMSAEDILFAVRYRIDTSFRKNCFSICDCPPVLR